MTSHSIPALIMATVALYVASYHFLIFIRRPTSRVDLTFALTSLCVGIFDISCVALYNTTTPAQGVEIQRWQLISLAFLSISFAWFVYVYTSMKSKLGVWIFTIIFFVFALIGLFDRSGLAWTENPLIKNFQFPYFGWNIIYYEMELGPAMYLEAFALLVFYVYSFFAALYFYRKNKSSRATLLVLAMAVFMLGVVGDAFIALGYYNFIYMTEYSFIGMILIMAYALSSEVVQRDKIKQELLESERRFLDLAENSTDWIWEFDENEIFTYSSPRVLDLLGYTSDEIIGESSFSPMASPHLEKVYKEFIKYKEARKPFSSLVNTNYHKNGKEIIIESSGVPLFDKNGRFSGYRGIDRDITKRVNLEEELRQAHKMEAIGTLAGGIAHDFNNILTVIQGYAEISMEGMSDHNSAKQKIEQILKVSDRAKKLVKHILAFSRKEPLERIVAELPLMVNEAVKFLRATIPTNIEIIEDVDMGSNYGNILANTTQIHQIIVNICTNSAQALEETGGVIEVGLSICDYSMIDSGKKAGLKNGSYVHLEIKDDGPGISHEIIDRIFDPYFTTKDIGKGSGMGLSVAQGIVASHDGLITVDSTPGKGTAFSIYFPQVDEAPAENIEGGVAIPSGTERVLVVDDEEMIVDITVQRLELLGYQVTGKTSSREAIDLIRAHPDDYDLIITDQTMLEMTGIQLAKEIMAINAEIPIILCTGYSNKIDADEAEALGIKAFLMKPADNLEIATTLRRVLDS